jgi:poly(hydroxyalkanoate) granule-associated protein
MAKKPSPAPVADEPATHPFDSQLAGAVKASAQQIWLAGMGAFAKAQEEGNKVFEALVKEGVGLQRKTQAAAEERIGGMSDKVSALAEEVGHKAGASWDKLESIFEVRTAKALARLGVPTAHDLARLNARIDELSLALARLGAAGEVQAPARKTAAPRKRAPAAKKTAAG